MDDETMEMRLPIYEDKETGDRFVMVPEELFDAMADECASVVEAELASEKEGPH